MHGLSRQGCKFSMQLDILIIFSLEVSGYCCFVLVEPHLTNSTLTFNSYLNRTTQIYEHPEWQGPYLGPRPTGQIKDWSEEKLRASEGIVPLQAGTNKFATQKGLRIGRARDIM